MNVAVRLEGLADPGGILISEDAYRQIHDKLEIDLRDRGLQHLKNIDEPVRAYAIRIESGDTIPSDAPANKSPPSWRVGVAAVVIAGLVGALTWQATRPPAVEAARVENMAFELPDRPSIAVLPFANLSGDPSQDFLSDGISEDILTSLSKLAELFVISRTTTAAYKGKDVTIKQVAEDLGVQFVLEGSVQRDGDSMRVTAQLIDALSGKHVWADSYDREVTDLFAVKDEITLNIVSKIGAEVGRDETELQYRNATESLHAWNLFQEGQGRFLIGSREDNLAARRLFEEAVSIDPTYTSALAQLANTYRVAAQFGWAQERNAAFEKSRENFDEAIQLDPSNAFTFSALTMLNLGTGQSDLAVQSASGAVSLDANDHVGHGVLAWSLNYAGNPSEAIKSMQLAMRLSPVWTTWMPMVLGDSQLLTGDFEASLATYRAALEGGNVGPIFQAWAHANMALALDGLGREEEARTEAIAAAHARSPGSPWRAV